MAITDFQRRICRLIAAHRIAQGESYIAGGVALNTLLQADRISRDIDIFHDSDLAIINSWNADKELLEAHGYTVQQLRLLPSFAEALVRKEKDSVVLQWARDSAFRFFPLLEDSTFGLTLHPFDLATNKVLALAGRLEARDWIDVLACHERIQNLGYLFWAACSKDPGFSPSSLLSEARRGGRYSADEISLLSFSGPAPDPAELGAHWHSMLSEAEQLIALLPAQEVGTCVISDAGELFRGEPARLKEALRNKAVHFHRGAIRGVWPRIIDSRDSRGGTSLPL